MFSRERIFLTTIDEGSACYCRRSSLTLLNDAPAQAVSSLKGVRTGAVACRETSFAASPGESGRPTFPKGRSLNETPPHRKAVRPKRAAVDGSALTSTKADRLTRIIVDNLRTPADPAITGSRQNIQIERFGRGIIQD
uniref:Uncharacterized protein n=1 Tax=Trichuris muris TaxID=70415 RepID=A0A5S6QCT2_TRIMR